jgi:hypothetical protein
MKFLQNSYYLAKSIELSIDYCKVSFLITVFKEISVSSHQVTRSQGMQGAHSLQAEKCLWRLPAYESKYE